MREQARPEMNAGDYLAVSSHYLLRMQNVFEEDREEPQADDRADTCD